MGIKYLINPHLPVIKPCWRGNILINNRFSNSTHREGYSIWNVLRWKLSPNPQRKEKKNDNFKLDVVQNSHFSQSENDIIVWLGHSTFFIRLGGVSFITDPFLYNAFNKKRLAPMPCLPESIKNVDYLLLSHDHRDHLNYRSVKTLVKHNPSIEALLPLRPASRLKKQFTNFQEAGWYQEYELPGQVKVFFMPAQHWARRGLFDRNKSLWGSFILQHAQTTLFFAGDTAYSNHFADIAGQFPQIDYAIIPIGAYKPRFIMAQAHISPEEAVEAVNTLKPKVFIPMHHATLDLSNEPIGEPYRSVVSMNNQGIINSHLKNLKIGEELRIGYS